MKNWRNWTNWKLKNWKLKKLKSWRIESWHLWLDVFIVVLQRNMVQFLQFSFFQFFNSSNLQFFNLFQFSNSSILQFLLYYGTCIFVYQPIFSKFENWNIFKNWRIEECKSYVNWRIGLFSELKNWKLKIEQSGCLSGGGDWVLVRPSIFNFQFLTWYLKIEDWKLGSHACKPAGWHGWGTGWGAGCRVACLGDTGYWLGLQFSTFNYHLGPWELKIENWKLSCLAGKPAIGQPGRPASWLAWVGYWLGSWLACCLLGGDWVLVRLSIFNYHFGTWELKIENWNLSSLAGKPAGWHGWGTG